MIVAWTITELESVQIEGHMVSDYVEEAGPGDIPSAAFQRGYRQSSGQIAFERNESGLRRRGEVRERAMVGLYYWEGGVGRKRDHLGYEHSGAGGNQFLGAEFLGEGVAAHEGYVMKIGSRPVNRAQEIRAATGW